MILLSRRLRAVPSILFLLAVVSLACASNDSSSPIDPARAGVVASWDSGSLGLEEIEQALSTSVLETCRKARRQGGLENLIPCYRELSEALVLERLVLADVADLAEATRRVEGFGQLEREALLGLFLSQVRTEISIEPAEIERHFEADPERFRQPRAVELSTLFRRHENPSQPEATLAYLEDLKRRFEAGASFSALSRSHSHSETRSRGGEVGSVSEFDLPPRLAQVAFSLEVGEVSDPVLVRNGAILLHVRGARAAVEPSLSSAELEIRRELLRERIRSIVSEHTKDLTPPAGSTVLTSGELSTAVEAGVPDRMVLEVEGDSLDLAALHRLAGIGNPGRALTEAQFGQLEAEYRHQIERRLLGLELVRSPPPDLSEAAFERVRRNAIDRLVDDRVQEALDLRLDETVLQEYYADNRLHYQSPLRLELRLWSLPFGDDPPAQLRQMEQFRADLIGHRRTLDEAVQRLGGVVRELGWRTIQELPSDIPPKARTYLAEAASTGYSVPYQQAEELHLFVIDARQDPLPLPYGEVKEEVRSDYLRRFHHQLYREMLDERLAARSFQFHETALHDLLIPSGDRDPTAVR